METNETTPWKTTIIMSVSLQNHEVYRMLRAQQHRIRLSGSVEAGSVIFPLSGTAFLLAEPQGFPESLDHSEFFELIEKFTQVHRNCFLLLFATFSGKGQLQTLTEIQSRFFGSNLRILPVQNAAEIVRGMLAIAKATSKPHADRIQACMSLVRAHIIENSPVWDILRDIKPTCP
ncbi:protein SPO16 homolog [Nothobranchius furzeri]|uniref:Chromosome 1 open reading frame 146 n=2 Tax=Nothobranchius furzeri TaxID=105023 RepID=A0A8C6L6N5_NOTFU|nr:hypothetical protein G4P62_011774 [Nothobranchius furzeri]